MLSLLISPSASQWRSFVRQKKSFTEQPPQLLLNSWRESAWFIVVHQCSWSEPIIVTQIHPQPITFCLLWAVFPSFPLSTFPVRLIRYASIAGHWAMRQRCGQALFAVQVAVTKMACTVAIYGHRELCRAGQSPPLPPKPSSSTAAVASRQKDHAMCAKIAHGKCVAAYCW